MDIKTVWQKFKIWKMGKKKKIWTCDVHKIGTSQVPKIGDFKKKIRIF